ncbi:MAG: TIM barrel protein, partial [Verrucomicrobiota bacterium]
MNLKLFKTLWGHQGSLALAIEQAVEAGFDGIEGPVPDAPGEQEILSQQLQEAGLEMIAEITTGGSYVPDPALSPERHLDDLRRGIERSLTIEPRFINTMAGLDAWPFATQVSFFEELLRLEQEFRTTITIETHRSRSTFTPWVTRDLIRELPDLKLNLDFSHWCCVSERLVLHD